MNGKGNTIRLLHILEHARAIPRWLSGVKKEDFLNNDQLQAAIIRQYHAPKTSLAQYARPNK